MISAAKEKIIKAYYPGYFMQSVMGQIQTKQVRSEHDDSYQGKRGCLKLIHIHILLFAMQCEGNVCTLTLSTGYSVAVGEFSGDQVEGKSHKIGYVLQILQL